MSEWMDAEAHADRALEWFERGRWAEAEAELRKAIFLNPDQAEWHFNLGLTLEAAGRESEALASYEHASGLMPGEVEPMVAAGVLANRLDQPRRAIDVLKLALKHDRTVEVAYAHLMESHLRLGDHDEVEATFYLAQQEVPELGAQCLAVMAESLIQRGVYGRAEWCLREALRADARLPRLRARLGTVLAATERPERAIQLFIRDLRDDPGNIETLLDYGEVLLDLGRLPDAAEKFRRVLELEPANVDAHHRLGRIGLITRRFERATLEFELVQKLDVGFPQVRLDLAEALLGRERLAEMRRVLQQEMERVRVAEQTTTEETIADERQDVAVDLTDPQYFRRFGDLLLAAGCPRSSARLYRRAVALAGRDADLHRRLALACFRAADPAGGAAASRKALRLDPKCIRSIHNLALAALRAGRLQIAGGWIARGLNTDRNDDGMRRLRMRLWFAVAWRAIRSARPYGRPLGTHPRDSRPTR